MVAQGNRTTLTGLPPAKQALFSGLGAYFALVQPQLQQVVIGQTDFSGRAYSKNFHNLVAIQFRSN